MAIMSCCCRVGLRPETTSHISQQQQVSTFKHVAFPPPWPTLARLLYIRKNHARLSVNCAAIFVQCTDIFVQSTRIPSESKMHIVEDDTKSFPVYNMLIPQLAISL